MSRFPHGYSEYISPPTNDEGKNPVGKMSIQINNCICFEYGSNTYCCVLRQMQYATSIGSLLVDSAPGAGDLTLHTHTSHTHAHTLQHYICYFVYFKFLIQNRVAISLPGRSTLFTLLLCFFSLFFITFFILLLCFIHNNCFSMKLPIYRWSTFGFLNKYMII